MGVFLTWCSVSVVVIQVTMVDRGRGHATYIQCLQDGADSNRIESLATLTSGWLLLTINAVATGHYSMWGGPLSMVGIQFGMQLNQRYTCQARY